MTRTLLAAAAFLWIATVSRADDQKIDSKVQKVVVFLNGAQVTRTAMVNVNAGASVLTFGGISPDIDVQSIQVHANGEFTILSVKHEMNYLEEQARQKSVDDLKAQQKAIRQKIDMQNSLISIYEEEAIMLKKNQVVSGQNANLDITKLKQAMDFQTEQLTEIKKKEQELSDQVAMLQEELKKYDLQIADITKGSSKATSNILVMVSSKIPVQTEFTLSYVVHNASWFPTYDVRAKDVNSPLSIFYKANVSQQSGEDWKNVKLVLSTGNPAISGSKPDLDPYYLNFGMYYRSSEGALTRVNGKVTGADDRQPIPGATVKIKGTSIGTVTDVNGNYSLQLPNNAQQLVVSFIGYTTQTLPINSDMIDFSLTPAASALNEVVVTGYTSQRRRDATGAVSTINMDNGSPGSSYTVNIRGNSSLDEKNTIPVGVDRVENQTNVEFDITNPYSIPSDGKQYTVDINQLNLDAMYEYAVVPKLSTDVFLTAKLTDWNKYNFLSGEANLFFEGTFIGKSLINTDATADTLSFSLGTDKNIVVTRTSLKDLTEKQGFGSNKKETRDWQIEVKNRKKQPVNLLVEDQVPVSQNSSIEVETEELSDGRLDKTTGKVLWNFVLNPQDDKKVELKYQVKYPKNQTVIVQ
ncbi:MAG TPA: mucoidy inhibitor MuiA family protein [Mucilaginibacter sp.]|nr:mucoidy inhibitor MuiA family protein [Mucilaginibacter sp.]